MGDQAREALSLISTNNSFDLCEVLVDDWDDMLTPWPSEGCFKDRSFGGRAREVLCHLVGEFAGLNRPVYIAGYSLAGLFAMWSLYSCDLFAGAVCGSASFWYPEWETFSNGAGFSRDVKIYMSLGNKEHKVGHPLMRRIKDITQSSYDKLSADSKVEKIVLEWNDGGHFNDVGARMARGISWIVE